MEWLALVLIGIIAGVLSGLFGIGGGVIIVPALILLLGFTVLEAVSTSLGALLMPVGIFAVITYHRNDLLHLRDSILIALGLLGTSALGALGALEIDRLDPDLMKQIYGLFLLYMGWRFAEPRKIWWAWRRRSVDAPAAPLPPDSPAEGQSHPWYSTLLIGLVAGVFSGMFGIGGGVVIVPALVTLLHYDQRRAVGTSLGALLLPVGLPGVLVYSQDGVLDFPVAAAVALGLVFGSVLGAQVALTLSSGQVKRLYGLFLVAVALRFIFF